MVKGRVFALNYLEISASPLLQKCGHEHACETEHETKELDCVDEYHRRGRGERTFDRRIRGVNSNIGIGARKLLGYMCEEGMGGDVGILPQGRIAEGNEGSHRGREEASLESESDRACKNTTSSWLTRSRNIRKRGCLLRLPSKSPQIGRAHV